MLNALVGHYGWAGLAERIALRCFAQDPSLASSLKVLRKTPWARAKVESLYLFMLREQRRQPQRPQQAPQAPPPRPADVTAPAPPPHVRDDPA